MACMRGNSAYQTFCAFLLSVDPGKHGKAGHSTVLLFPTVSAVTSKSLSRQGNLQSFLTGLGDSTGM